VAHIWCGRLVFQGKLLQDRLPAALSSFGLHLPLPQSRQGGSTLREKILTDSLFDQIRKRIKAAERTAQHTQ